MASEMAIHVHSFLMSDYESKKSLIQHICNELDSADWAEDMIKKYLVKPAKMKKVKKDGPKRPKNAYMLFCDDNRKKLQDKGLIMTEVSKELGKMWKKLDDKKKQPYIEKNKKLKEQYQEEVDNFANFDKKTKTKNIKAEEDTEETEEGDDEVLEEGYEDIEEGDEEETEETEEGDEEDN